MDDEYEPKHNANMMISKAVGDYMGDEDSSKISFIWIFVIYPLRKRVLTSLFLIICRWFLWGIVEAESSLLERGRH